MPLYVWLIVFHPILVSIVAFTALALLLGWTGLWARYKYRILLALLAAYAVDAAFALPRILFAQGLSKGPVIAQRIPLPSRLVLVSVRCDAKCHDWLISGAVDEIISVTPRYPHHVEVATAVRYRAGWTLPGACPRERERAIWLRSPAQQQSGYCPLVEPVDIPTQGVFVVHEATIVTAKETARAYTPAYLVKAPPGPVIKFGGHEVQDRSSAGITVLASAYVYQAPGLLGLPPLVGCWDRPDNILWIMPPGDTGCGLWRWFTGGGDNTAVNDPKWIFEQAFGPPEHPLVPPKRDELPPPAPGQALEILSRVSDVELHLPRLRDALLDPANTDAALTDLVVRLVRLGRLEGSLVALLANNRPSALTGFSAYPSPVPIRFNNSGAVLEVMEANPAFREEFADTLFRALAGHWPPNNSDNVRRFLSLMSTNNREWLCERLNRLSGPDGLLKAREDRIIKDETMPPFVPLLVEKTAQICPRQTAAFLRELLAMARPERRAMTTVLIVRILHASGRSCDIPVWNVPLYVKQKTEPVALDALLGNLEDIQGNQAGGPCR
jgi:hypothetical protein